MAQTPVYLLHDFGVKLPLFMRCSVPKLVEDFSVLVHGELSRIVAKRVGFREDSLCEAIGYALTNPGKCIRPFLVNKSAKVFGVCTERILPVSAAVEIIHIYSLVHDDLPSMDNAQIRRGQESCHKKFGEAIAILVGDSLLTLAFELLSGLDEDCTVKCEIMEVLSKACGCQGMARGQALDILGVPTMSPEEIQKIHELKTAKLFSAACELGAILGHGSREERSALAAYGRYVGFAFQAKDDMDDVHTDGESANLARAWGIENTREYVDEMLHMAKKCLKAFPRNTGVLEDFIRFIKNLGL